MRVARIALSEFGPYHHLEPIPLARLTTLIGKNDVGKSSIIRALELFFSDGGIQPAQVHTPPSGAGTFVQVSFTGLPPTLELESGVTSTFEEESLLDDNSELTVRKTYDSSNPKRVDVSLKVLDFVDPIYAQLSELKEKELLGRGAGAGLSFPKSGAGITNKSRRQALRSEATRKGITRSLQSYELLPKGTIWSSVKSAFPDLVSFESETEIATDSTAFQSEFRPIVNGAVQDAGMSAARESLSQGVGAAVQREIQKIFAEFRKHTDEFTSLRATTDFAWERAAKVEVWGTDRQGVDRPLESRGSGFRRIFMVAFFQYLAKARNASSRDTLFAIEEPENSLHPGLQRELASSLRALSNTRGQQILVTSHSPVFAGESDPDGLLLVTRTAGTSTVKLGHDVDLMSVARELGIEPSDQLAGYSACVFLEGPSDVEFLECVATKLKSAGAIQQTPADCNIGLIPCGGDNLRYLVNRGHLIQLSRRFAVVVDSDRTAAGSPVSGRKLNSKRDCESAGGLFHILRKREIENYLHPDALTREGKPQIAFDDFSDMKDLFGDNVFKVVRAMTAVEISERDLYVDGSAQKHELAEILTEIASLTHPPITPTQ